jgi:acetoacetyl-CoA synthetase
MTEISSVELLVPIWNRVLQRSSVQVNDDFFDLGGNPALAAQLFSEIAAVFGRHLSPVLIYSARTIESLAAMLERSEPFRIPPLLLLKGGSAGPAVFIAHGLGDTVLNLFHLVGKIQSSNPIYGMQARGIDGVDEPLATIEGMAQFHLDAIKQVQPHGPYFLIGYSLGGLVALEIAQRLSAAGERIALLALIDSYPDRKQLGLSQRALLSFRLAKRRLWSRRESLPSGTRSQISPISGGNAAQTNQLTAMRAVAERMRESAYLALRRYRPRFYPGKIRFVKAEISTDFPSDPVPFWSHLAEQFEVDTIPGDHQSMLTRHFEKLASTRTHYLRESST